MKNLDEKLGNVINFKGNAHLEITEKQYKTLKGFVYDYKITIDFNNDDINTRQGASIKIAQIYKAIKSGKVQKRVNRPKNCSVRKIKGVLRLVENQDINGFEHVVNGFGQFIEEENERQNKWFMQQHEEWLNKQETKSKRKASANA